MGLFRANFDRPGPGIPKGLPPKTGFALFLDILVREFWSLMQLNIIYVLCCIPIITIGPATAALSRAAVTMVRDENVYPWRDFKEALKKNWKQGLLFGIICTLVVVTQVWTGLFALSMAAYDSSVLWVLGPVLAASLIGAGVGMYIFPMIAYVQLPAMDILRNAIFLAFLGKWNTLGCALVVGALNIALLFLWPLSMPFALLLHFSFTSLVSALFAWPVICKFVLKSAEENTEDEKED